MTTRPRFIVRLRVDPQYEEEFTRWYNDEYLTTLQAIAAPFTHCARYVSRLGDDVVYLTIYEIADGASTEQAMAVFDRVDRQEWRKQWQAWEKKALREFEARWYHPIYSW